MKQFEVKEVRVWDGGDRHNFGFYVDPSVPNAAIEKFTPHCSISHKVLTIFDTLEERAKASNLELRKSAWRKLSLSEREALGMVEEPK